MLDSLILVLKTALLHTTFIFRRSLRRLGGLRLGGFERGLDTPNSSWRDVNTSDIGDNWETRYT